MDFNISSLLLEAILGILLLTGFITIVALSMATINFATEWFLEGLARLTHTKHIVFEFAKWYRDNGKSKNTVIPRFKK